MSDTVKEYTHCLRCGRALKNTQAKQIGYGIVCYKKLQTDRKIPLFKFKR